jgi:hypothetical protein
MPLIGTPWVGTLLKELDQLRPYEWTTCSHHYYKFFVIRLFFWFFSQVSPLLRSSVPSFYFELPHVRILL